MEIHTRTVGDVHVLDISGKITLGEATKTIRHTVSDLLENGGKKIVLNLTTSIISTARASVNW